MTNLWISQNFLNNEKLVNSLIKASGINESDTVIDIGAGKGIITKALAQYAKQVIAFELDPVYFNLLQKNLSGIEGIKNISILNSDFLNYNLENLPEFKVFSNIPFNISSEIFRKILLGENLFQEGYFVVQEETAHRYLGLPYKEESLLSLLIKPFYKLQIVHEFRRSDFIPAPNVDTVLLSIIKKQDPEIPSSKSEQDQYRDFISYLLNLRKPNIKTALMRLFTYPQIKRISKDLRINLREKPSKIEYQKYIKIFSIFTKLSNKQEDIKGAYAKLIRHYSKLILRGQDSNL